MIEITFYHFNNHLNLFPFSGPGMASQKEEPGTSGPVSVMRGSNDKVPLLSNMSKSIPDTRLDLGQLEGPARNGDDPEDLRHIVRQELRKIVDVSTRLEKNCHAATILAV